ncbi:glucosyltransferase domain-containing protein [Enterococcus sp. UD-01]|uniref:glucosyltransferase domain-containing protein n=1 Tax=Enterococcus sp. UD-01 TaxID=3373911 RepID=UPI003833E804
MQKQLNQLYYWCKENKSLLIMTILIYQAAILAIGVVNFPYMDDTVRQRVGNTDFASTYSRWGSEIGSWLVQGSRHLTDMGLVTPILTGFILAAASIIVVYTLNNQKLRVLPLVVSTLIGLNPWFLQCVSFRFDSPYLALSVFCSVLPFLWWEKQRGWFFGLSVLSIFMMCNTYQASSGIYIVMVLALSLKTLLADNAFVPLLKKIITAAGAYILTMLLYFLEMKLHPELAQRGNNVVIASITEIPKTFLANSRMYPHTILDQSTKVWVILFVLLMIAFIVTGVQKANVQPAKALLFLALYLVLGAILSYGVFLIFPEKLAIAAPRYAYGFSVFATITFLLLLENLETYPWLRLATKGIICLLCYYLLSFPFIYASSLHYQKEAFERQSVILAEDLKQVVSADTKNVYATMLFKDSPVFINTARNYPILTDLVPVNSAIFFPNQVLFRTYSGMDLTILPFELDHLDKKQSTLKLSDYYYDIYEKGQDVYVVVK